MSNPQIPHRRTTEMSSASTSAPATHCAEAPAKKQSHLLLIVLLIVAIAAAGVLAWRYADVTDKLEQTQTALDSKTAEQEATAATLTETEAALAAKTAELEATAATLTETEAALAAKTAEQEATAATLTETEAALAAKTAEQEATAATLTETEAALTAKTAEQEATAATLTETEAALAAKTAEQEATAATLTETEAALAAKTAEQEATAATLTETEAALAAKTAELQATVAKLAETEAKLAAAQTFGMTETDVAAPAVSVEVGDVITFGHYEQDDTTASPEEIEWIVLDVADGKALVVSKLCLAGRVYHGTHTDVTWETSDMRAWLNSDFINEAFTAQEQEAIVLTQLKALPYPGFDNDPGNDTQDKLFLLDVSDVVTYMPTAALRNAHSSTWAGNHGASVSRLDERTWWWLRTPGEKLTQVAYISNGSKNGDIKLDDVDYVNTMYNVSGGVRPAMWLDLTKLGQ